MCVCVCVSVKTFVSVNISHCSFLLNIYQLKHIFRFCCQQSQKKKKVICCIKKLREGAPQTSDHLTNANSTYSLHGSFLGTTVHSSTKYEAFLIFAGCVG